MLRRRAAYSVTTIVGLALRLGVLVSVVPMVGCDRDGTAETDAIAPAAADAPDAATSPKTNPTSIPVEGVPGEGEHSLVPALKLEGEPSFQLKEPSLKPPSGGILYVGEDGESDERLDKADSGMVSSQDDPELAPPPERPSRQPDSGVDRVEQ